MNIINQLKSDEGRGKSEPYKCTGDKWTIGYGRNVEDNPLTEREAEFLLMNDVEQVYYKLRDMGLVSSDGISELTAREGVLVNMAFQMGVSGLLRFKNALKAYQLKDWRTCAEEMLDSRWATQTPNRARRLVDQMISGEWQ